MSNKEVTKFVFVSLPMSGKTLEKIRAEMAELYAKFTRETHRVGYVMMDTTDPLWHDDMTDRDDLCQLGNDLIKLSRATVAYFPKGYESARGCSIEHQAAEAYGIPHYHEGEASCDSGAQKT